MNITPIKSTPYTGAKIIKYRGDSVPNFKGYTHEVTIKYPGRYEHYKPHYNMIENLSETGTQLDVKDLNDREYKMYRELDEIPPRIYVASPNEKIPEKIYKTHTHIQRNDLYLSQIKKDYPHGYKNFAQNAYLEAEYYKELQKNKNTIINKNTKEIDSLTKKHEVVSKENLSPKLKERFEKDYKNKINALKKEIDETTRLVDYADKNLDKAEKRFEVLKEMDELGGQYNQLMADIAKVSSLGYTRPSMSFYRCQDAEKNIEKIEPLYNKKVRQLERLEQTEEITNKEKAVEKAKTELQKIKQQLDDARAELKHWQNVYAQEDKQREKLLSVDKSALRIKMDKTYENIASFYKENYPQWADV